MALDVLEDVPPEALDSELDAALDVPVEELAAELPEALESEVALDEELSPPSPFGLDEA